MISKDSSSSAFAATRQHDLVLSSRETLVSAGSSKSKTMEDPSAVVMKSATSVSLNFSKHVATRKKRVTEDLNNKTFHHVFGQEKKISVQF